VNSFPTGGGCIWQTLCQDTHKSGEILTCPICPSSYVCHFTCSFSPEIASVGLKSDEYEEIVRRLGVIPIKQSWECSAACGPSIAATKLTAPSSNFPLRRAHSRRTRRKRRCSRLGDGLDWRLKLNPTTTLQLLNPSRSCYGSGRHSVGSSRWGASHCRVELPALRFPRRCPDAAVHRRGIWNRTLW